MKKSKAEALKKELKYLRECNARITLENERLRSMVQHPTMRRIKDEN